MSKSKGVVCVVGAGTKYASNPNYHADTPKDGLADQVKFGLGGALPMVFAAQGYDVAIMSRSLDNLKPIEAMIKAGTSGRECFSVACDCSDPASIKGAFAAVRQRFGEDSVISLVYNAGYAQPEMIGGRNPMGGQMVEELSVENFNASYEVHIRGLLLCAQEVLPSMRKRQTGSILVTGNTMSLRGGAKFGMKSVTDSGSLLVQM